MTMKMMKKPSYIPKRQWERFRKLMEADRQRRLAYRAQVNEALLKR
jgi:hypothetical protein